MKHIVKNMLNLQARCDMMQRRNLPREVCNLPKSAKKAQQASAAAEREQQELEALRQRMRAETTSDMAVLRALMDAERQAKGVEQAAEDYSVGVEWRVMETVSEIDAEESAEVKRLSQQDAVNEAKKADERIAAVRADVEKKRAELAKRFEAHRSEYVDKVFNLVIGAEDE